jgi:D-tagatose-1,6-bisphosphate aldolase subunit GatZ/KbaZ
VVPSPAISNVLLELASSRRRDRPLGIYSVCSAHHWVLEAACDQAVEDGSTLLVEATSNQVNHRGGYTGMTPADFERYVLDIARERGLPSERLILGGDHLGPNPWRHLPAQQAMEEAASTVRAYVRAGFRKIHLDASMACADDSSPLSDEIVARRAAVLCAACEEESRELKPLYVIGTEVPTPGGATEKLGELAVTTRESAEQTLTLHRRIFEQMGLGYVWPRVIALVVQPGVEFDHTCVVDYNPARSVHLSELLDRKEALVYEAHSTDYQKPEAFRKLVQGGFAILKVGPALTFAMREALDALARIEAELLPREQCSQLFEVIEQVMLRNRRDWEHHYAGDERTVRLLLRYSYSDRVRYYWNNPEIERAVATLLSNLSRVAIPETLLSAFMPDQYGAVRAGTLQPDAHALIVDRIRKVLLPYAQACAP